jgi:hypothetical protein
MYTASHSAEILANLMGLGPDEQDDYLRRLVPAVTRDPFTNTSLYARGHMAYRVGRFGHGRRVLIRVDHAEQAVWFVRIL